MNCAQRHVRQRQRVRSLTLFSAFAWQAVQTICCFAQAPPDPAVIFQAQLEARVARSPGDATSWRLLGKWRLQRGDRQGAQDALLRAVQLDPGNPAARFCLAQALLALGRSDEAVAHLKEVLALAPQSEYAQQAQAHLAQLLPPEQASRVVQASYEIKQFDGADVPKLLADRPLPLDDSPWPWNIHVESGALYNTNVALSPLRRDLDAKPRESFQGFFNTSLEYALWDGGGWRVGPAFTGYFSANEGDFQAFNLQSYQPGAFLEYATLLGDDRVLVPRVQYDYTLDRLGDLTFGQRHALGVSLADYARSGGFRIVYWTIDFTDFVNDGQSPPLTSRDGWTNTLGLSRTFEPALDCVNSFRLGAEVQRADTEGRDHRYNGVAINGDIELPLWSGASLRLEGGLGYRDYPDFDLSPPRNEFIWQAGLRCRQQLTDHWSLSLVVNYQRFDSENEAYAADRYVGGLVTTVEF
jgi:tetratricopeptide (TPR) repeat protein